MDSRVSIVIPTYNRCRLLAQTLDSVCAQTQRDFEIIVIDDGSTDATSQVIAGFANRLVYHRIEHAGASAARNAGLVLARGEYTAFLDSDDLWERDFMERMVPSLEAAPGAGFAYCDYSTFSANGIEQAAYLADRHKVNGNLFTLLLETDFLSTGTLLIRRSCFAHVGGFDPTLEVVQDWDLWLRLAREFNAVYVDAPLVRIRVDSDGLTRNRLRLHADNLRVLGKWRAAVRGNALQKRIIRRNMRASHRSLAGICWEAHRPWLAFNHRLVSLTGRFL